MIKINLIPAAADIVKQLRTLVPVRTGRLRNSIRYKISRKGADYVISLVMEDYIKWLKPRTRTPKLPTAKELAMARPPLPKMNDLHMKGINDLSSRSQGIFRRIDIESAFGKLDPKILDEEIRKIIAYDKLD